MRINCLTRGKEEENEFHLSFHSFTLSFPAGKKKKERERERERERRYMYMIQRVIEECMYTTYTYI